MTVSVVIPKDTYLTMDCALDFMFAINKQAMLGTPITGAFITESGRNSVITHRCKMYGDGESQIIFSIAGSYTDNGERFEWGCCISSIHICETVEEGHVWLSIGKRGLCIFELDIDISES